ncbi:MULTISPECIES: GAP family protein [unclassified Mycobacterium]|uniref:GAP family protein n=1 Tax=unclassified Mycobacterium TaxID=2642494 RepID=UPI0018D49583|nr:MULTISPECIES: GAP family protein [unclassified Mycobacterium]
MLTLLLTFDPVRLGVVLLLISRPRPVSNLLVYWIGAMTVSVPYVVIPLIVLHLVPSFRSFAQRTARTFASPAVHHIQIGVGVLAITVAALLAARFWARRRALLTAPNGGASTLAPDSNTPIPPLQRDAPAQDASVIRRFQGRAITTWEGGSLRVPLVIGLAMGPPPLSVLLVLTTIVASGAAIGTQVALAFAWVFVIFAVVEIPLLSYLAAPAKTQAALQLLHDWVSANRRQVVIGVVALAGVAMFAVGIGGV